MRRAEWGNVAAFASRMWPACLACLLSGAAPAVKPRELGSAVIPVAAFRRDGATIIPLMEGRPSSAWSLRGLRVRKLLIRSMSSKISGMHLDGISLPRSGRERRVGVGGRGQSAGWRKGPNSGALRRRARQLAGGTRFRGSARLQGRDISKLHDNAGGPQFRSYRTERLGRRAGNARRRTGNPAARQVRLACRPDLLRWEGARED